MSLQFREKGILIEMRILEEQLSDHKACLCSRRN